MTLTKDCQSFNLDLGWGTAIRRRYYLPEESKPVYEPKAGKDEKVFDAFEQSVLNQPSNNQPFGYAEKHKAYLFSIC